MLSTFSEHFWLYDAASLIQRWLAAQCCSQIPRPCSYCSQAPVSDRLPLSACSCGLTWFPRATAVLFYVLHCLSSSANLAETWCWGAYMTNFCSLRTCTVFHKRRNGRVHGWNQSQGMNVDSFFVLTGRDDSRTQMPPSHMQDGFQRACLD